MKISLVIPVKNEEKSLESLYKSICKQTRLPDEIVLVDGGSSDKTVEIARKLADGKLKFKIVETSKASPGKGRNIGVENAENDWIAFTDAGIILEKDWLEKLIEETAQNPSLDMVLGTYEPKIQSFFEKCAALTYTQPRIPVNGGLWRGPFIASSLLHRSIWKETGGFPDLRAAEDLIFIENVRKQGFNVGYAPKALVWWQLRPTISSTFDRFVLYSKNNVWAGRQHEWQYGVLKQYLILLPFILLAIMHSWEWIIVLPMWLSIRTAKSIWQRYKDFSKKIYLFDPLQFLTVSSLILLIDLAMFIGWGQSLLSANKLESNKN